MVFRQGTLSDTTRMRRCLTRTNALAVIASHVRILCRNGMSERDQRGFAPLLNGGKNPPPAHTRQMDGLTPLSHRVPTFLSALSIFLWTVSVVGLSVSFFYVRSLFQPQRSHAIITVTLGLEKSCAVTSTVERATPTDILLPSQQQTEMPQDTV